MSIFLLDRFWIVRSTLAFRLIQDSNISLDVHLFSAQDRHLFRILLQIRIVSAFNQKSSLTHVVQYDSYLPRFVKQEKSNKKCQLN